MLKGRLIFAKMKERRLSQIFLIIMLVLAITSCSTVQKRRYNSGFAFNWNKQQYGSIGVEERRSKLKATTAEKITVDQSIDIDKPQSRISENQLGVEQINNCIKENLIKDKGIQYSYPHLLQNNKELLLTDFVIMKQEPPTSQLPREPIGEIGFWYAVISTFLLIVAVIIGAIIGHTFLPGWILYLLFASWPLALVSSTVSLIRYNKNQKRFRGKKRIIFTLLFGLFTVLSVLIGIWIDYLLNSWF